MIDFYEILGVHREATQREIKEAYLKLIKKYHPDLAEDKIEYTKKTQEINEAYTTLKNAVKRSKYDSLLILKEQYGAPEVSEEEYRNEYKEQNTTDKQVPDIVCEKCGRCDSTLRVSIFIKVICFFIFSTKEGWSKILCSKCRIKYTLLWCTEVWFLGWWSPYGLYWSIDALIKNGKGGVQPIENNVSLLKFLVYKFYSNGRYNEAYKALKAVIKMTRSDTKYEKSFAEYLKNFISRDKPSFVARLLNAPVPVYGYSYILLLFISTILLFSSGGGTESKYNQPTTNQRKTELPPITTSPGSTDPKPKEKEPELKILSMPQNGTTKILTKKKRIAPLKITASEYDNYFVKVIDCASDDLILTIFIRAGKSVETKVPLGLYCIRYAVGANWYGDKNLFGKWTNYYQASESFEFEIINNRVRGYEIELYLRPHGNLHTEVINEENF